MKKMIPALLLAVLSFSCSGDDKNEICLDYAPAPITEVTEMEPGQAVAAKFNIELTVINGCGEFGKFESVIEGNTVTVVAIGKYVGCVCDQALKQVEGVYEFNPVTPGTYTLKFRQQDGAFITKEVIVN
jgi:hypothetical protein